MNEADHIVNILLEDGDAEADAFLDTFTAGFKQIGGDFGSPWEHGGSWYNFQTSDIVHCEGLGFDNEDKASWDMELSDEEMQVILQQFPDEPSEQERVEQDRDEAIENLKQEKADAFNANRKLPVYRFLDESLDDWSNHLPNIISQFGEGQEGQDVWDSMSRPQQWLQVGQYMGFHELDHMPDNYTKAELEKLLGLNLC